MIAVLFAVVRIFMHDDDFYHECMVFELGVRAIAEELPDDVVLEVILGRLFRAKPVLRSFSGPRFWVRNTFSKPASLKRASLVQRD